MKRNTLLSLMLLLALSLFAQDKVNNDSIVADFNYLIKLLETTHPDPYSGFGGKVFFHKQANRLENELRTQPCTQLTFWNKVMSFLSNIQDGHTYLNPPQGNQSSQLHLLVELRCISEGLIVQALPIAHKDLLGSMLIGINGRSIDKVLSLIAQNHACENSYDRYSKLSISISSERFIKQLFV